MHVLVTGSTGLIGEALIAALTARGDKVTRLVRKKGISPSPSILWDPEKGLLDESQLNGIDAVVHLAGDNIAEGRWTSAKKVRIRESRVRGTGLLCSALMRMKQPPRVVVSASAIGYYGNRADERLDEDSEPGTGFLPEVCVAWEHAARPILDIPTRLVTPRIGAVLSSQGGALAKMLPVFRIGAGGVVGSGKQHMSWIAIDDLVNAFIFLLNSPQLSGPFNLVSPGPIPNREFTRTLARALRRPAVFPTPAVVLRALFGEMADAVLISSARVYPTRLLDTGFRFGYPDLESALKHVLAK